MGAYIDRTFRKYGEDFFGKRYMDQITDVQVEEARCYAMSALKELTEKLGKRPEGTVQELFCNYIFGTFG